MKAIILVGGLGTRLGKLTKSTPKPMLPIRSKPFIALLLKHLFNSGFTDVVLATGYKHNIISDYFLNFDEKFPIPKISFSVESSPLGTGGAIKKAIGKINSENIFIFNGDTFLDINYTKFLEFHKTKNADVSLCSNFVKEGSRYGFLSISESCKLQSISKEKFENGYISAGIYIIKKSIFKNLQVNDINGAFSFEDEILKAMVDKLNIYCFKTSTFFIDIGIPDDYSHAQKVLFNE